MILPFKQLCYVHGKFLNKILQKRVAVTFKYTDATEIYRPCKKIGQTAVAP